MKKFSTRQKVFIIAVILLTCSIGSIFLLRNKHFEEYRELVTIKKVTFEVQLATTDSERAEGLMNVESMPEDEGMLFVYDKENYRSFWMKNTLIPLDMIFIDDAYHIVDIFHNAKPCPKEPCQTYRSAKRTKYILEINGGLSNKYKFKMGDIVEFTDETL